jgi:hypothetical protein
MFLPCLDNEDNIKYNIKIGRTGRWKYGRREDYASINLFSQPVRLLFCCFTDDCVGLETFLHRSFINDTKKDPVRRELFKVEEDISTQELLTKKFKDLIQKSGIKSKDVTKEQKEFQKSDIMNDKELENFIIKQGRVNSNEHIKNRTSIIDKLNMTLLEFKTGRNKDLLSKSGGSKNKPKQYSSTDFMYDLGRGFLVLNKLSPYTCKVEDQTCKEH